MQPEPLGRLVPPTVVGIFPAASLVNHSCEPNASFHSRRAGPGGPPLEYVLRCTTDVAAGEEICVSYLAHFANAATKEVSQNRPCSNVSNAVPPPLPSPSRPMNQAGTRGPAPVHTSKYPVYLQRWWEVKGISYAFIFFALALPHVSVCRRWNSSLFAFFSSIFLLLAGYFYSGWISDIPHT